MNNRNRGKNTGDDVLFGSEKQLEKLRFAVQDMEYLLGRKYAERAASELVGNRYRLKTRQIQAVRSAAASELQIQSRKSKELQFQDLQDKTIYLDGFNVLILLESLFSGAYVFQGTDGCFRDLSGVHGTYKRVQQTQRSIDYVASFFRRSAAAEMVWIFDQPVSNSGRMKQMIMDFALENNLNWSGALEFNPDKFLVENAEIAVSSDAWILDHCKSWFNLVGFLIAEENLSASLIKMF